MELLLSNLIGVHFSSFSLCADVMFSVTSKIDINVNNVATSIVSLILKIYASILLNVNLIQCKVLPTHKGKEKKICDMLGKCF